LIFICNTKKQNKSDIFTIFTTFTFSPFVSFSESGESVKIVRSFFGNGINILDKYKKIIEKNNEEKEILKALLFAEILKSKKGSL